MIQIIDEFCKDTDILDDLYRYFYYAGAWQFDFLPHKDILKNKNEVIQKIGSIIQDLCATNSKFKGKGYEIWINVLTEEDNYLDYHIDCDEDTPEDSVIPAKMTATLYLGPHEEMEGGELVVNTQGLEHFKSFRGESIFDVKKELTSGEWITIPYKYNRTVLFEGQTPHAVLPITKIPKNQARISLIIASWDKEVKICR
tara:strand:- start:505 stop:1101 length:597 start_codon:yes stop_codon:yes gene_type:complete